MDQEFLERWGGQALADALVAAAAQRTQPCPDAPDGPAPYADATLPIPATTGAAPTDPTAIEAGPTETTIVLGGGPGEEPPALGATIELPADDQHELVVGGPDGEVIREEYIGDRGTVSGYGPLVRDADGNWSVLVTVEVGAAPEPTPEPSSEPSTPEPTIGPPSPEPPSPEPTLEPSTAEPSDGPTGTGDDTPASVDQPSRATDAPTAPEPDPGRPPELIGVPKAVAALVAELPPEGAGAVRNLTDHMAVLGEMLDEAGQAEVTIPAGDIASLEALRPDLVKQVRLGSGSIIVTVGLDDIHVPGADEPIKPVLDVLITPIVKDGRIEVRLSRFEDLQTHEVVRALLATLNGYAAHADRDGRFTLVWVTPEGITVTATSKTPE